ncbi:MAG: AraC family transcriptional regulator, partial [Kurthia sp.]
MNLTSLYVKLKHYGRFQVGEIAQGNQSIQKNEHILLIALNYDLKLYIDQVAMELRQGSCVIISATQNYSIEANESEYVMRFIFDSFEIKGMEMIPLHEIPLLYGYRYNLLSSRIKQIVGNLEGEGHEVAPSSASMQMALMQSKLHIILNMMAQLDAQVSTNQIEEKISRIKQTITYMEQHYDEELTVEQLANMAGVIRWQYSQEFKKVTGKKPTDYLVHLRIEQAKELLCHSSEPINKICRRVGFKDEGYFSRCF